MFPGLDISSQHHFPSTNSHFQCTMRALPALGCITIILIWIVTFLALTSVVVSVVGSVTGRRKLRFSHWMNIAAFVVGMLLVGQTTWAIIAEGEGAHQLEMSLEQTNLIGRSLLVNAALWTLTTTLIRVSACFFLQEIFRVVRWARVTSWATIGLSSVHCLASILEVFLICRPLSTQWDPNAKGACGDQNISFVIIESVGLALDLVILWTPIPMLWKLHLPPRKKLQSFLVLDIGVLLLGFTAFRLKSLSLVSSPDFVWAQSYLGLLSATGAMLGVTLGAAGSYVALYKDAKTAIRSSWYRARQAQRSIPQLDNDFFEALGYRATDTLPTNNPYRTLRTNELTIPRLSLQAISM
ncbi:hypothetical protein BDV95DRAFT_361907 [Massariosphaeria phaeospora]|uniref:Rhodopsin domain-containing protein n=1 Tax=Massariosphaeria phaeospora TaxID=100035 RepID=A0A7C8MR57_9PLEO|nr:hypothetical protein BDV95DRAFT_361907 [Massariosphaeria phaeospora]